jgi:hypothetical protein
VSFTIATETPLSDDVRALVKAAERIYVRADAG